MEKKIVNILRKVLVVACIWFIVIPSVYLAIGLNNFFKNPTDETFKSIMLEATAICTSASVIALLFIKDEK